ncbi:MAG TPA: NAD(P)-binding domain-containing protein, partial [Terriglobia bacterium]|nr:NAD(P)-binding domain-containing protein [Terriglobia bacterium]
MVSTTLLAKSLDEQNDILTLFQGRVRERTARVGVVGMGYVGLPIALLFAKKGFQTTGFDIDPAKIESLRQGSSYIKHIPDSEIAREVQENQFLPTADFSQLSAMDAVIICVPTPLDDHREPDLSYIRATAESIGSNLRRGQLVVLESTTYP